MNTHRVDVLVHVDEPLETEELAALQEALGHIQGVNQVSRSARRQLVRVDYDPGATMARTIIEQVRCQGLSAQLVGM
jgi:hypothetical protein